MTRSQFPDLLQSREREVRLEIGTHGGCSRTIPWSFEMKNRRKMGILKRAIKPAIISPIPSLIIGALALPALALIPPPDFPASRPLHPAKSVVSHHRNFIDPTPALARRRYADADDYRYDPRYSRERAQRFAHERHERAERRWQEHTEHAARRAEHRVKERAEHLRHEWHEHVHRDDD
jgi:hypothetical protein